MLDLDTGVHLDEEELAAVRVEQVFQGARATIAETLRQAHRALAEGLALRAVQRRRRCLLEDLLAPPLQRAFAFEQMHRALAIAEDLHFDVPRLADEALQVHRRRTEGGLRLALGDGEFPTQFVGVVGDTDATPAAAGGGLDQQRIADLFGASQRRVEVAQFAGRARHHRHPGGHRGTPRLGLVAHAADGLRLRTDEDQAGRLHRFGEGGVLGEETVAGMDRVGTGFPRRHENRLDIQVAPVGPRRADQAYLIGQPRGQRIAIRLAAHRYRGNAQCLRGADDAHGDLAAIGHQQLVQSLVHGILLR